MPELQSLLQDLATEEDELRFAQFTRDIALKLGQTIVEDAQKRGLSIAVDIVVGDLQVFRYALEGTTADNADWIRRKRNMVCEIGHSSLYAHTLLQIEESSVEERYDLAGADYAAEGGSFPLLNRAGEMLGTATVSGLTGDQDHACVVRGLRSVLQ